MVLVLRMARIIDAIEAIRIYQLEYGANIVNMTYLRVERLAVIAA